LNGGNSEEDGGDAARLPGDQRVAQFTRSQARSRLRISQPLRQQQAPALAHQKQQRRRQAQRDRYSHCLAQEVAAIHHVI